MCGRLRGERGVWKVEGGGVRKVERGAWGRVVGE